MQTYSKLKNRLSELQSINLSLKQAYIGDKLITAFSLHKNLTKIKNITQRCEKALRQGSTISQITVPFTSR